MPRQSLWDSLIDAFEECDREGRALHSEYTEAAIKIMRARMAANRKTMRAAAWVVDAFDQADTGDAIRKRGTFSNESRREILVRAIDRLRQCLNGKKKNTLPKHLKNPKAVLARGKALLKAKGLD